MFAALSFAPFRYLFLNTFLAWFGSGFVMITLQDYLIQSLRSAGQEAAILRYVGLVPFFGMLPLFLFSVFAGVLADRVDRRRLLIASQTFRLVLGAAYFVLYATNHLTIPVLYGINFLMGTVQALVHPTRLAAVPGLVPKPYLLNAMALTNLAQYASMILGPVLAGVLIRSAGLQASFGMLTVLFGLAILPLIPLRLPPLIADPNSQATQARGVRGVVLGIAEGLRDAWRNRIIRVLLFTTALPGLFFIGPFTALAPLLARDVYGSDVRGQGLIQGAMGIGLIIGTLAVGSRHDLTGSGRKMIGVLAIGGVTLLLIGSIPRMPVGLPLLLLWGMSGGVFFSLNLTLIQREASDAMRGRIMSIVILFTQGCAPLGNLAATAAAAAIGTRTTLALGVQHTLQLAACCLLACIGSVVAVRARVLSLK